MNTKVNIVFGIIVLYLLYKNISISKKVETMANTGNIADAITKYYKADVQSIRNLAEVSQKLQEGKLTIPGNLTVKGSFNYLPKGTIVAFNGKIAPSGWALCDGKMGTPDLRGRFIYGYGARQGNKVGAAGGSETHKLSVAEMPSHNHSMRAAGHHSHNKRIKQLCYKDGGCAGIWSYHGGYGRGGWGNAGVNGAGNHAHHINNNGGNRAHNNMPPYYVLSWIMKL